jgi:hypothetical protein
MKGLLKDNFPEIIKEWDFEKNTVPFDTMTCGSAYLASWICSICGNKWKVDVCSRVSKRPGTPTRCPKCKRKRVKPEDRLDFRFPELSKQWNPNNKDSIDIVSYASNRDYGWICEKGHEWEASPKDRTNKGNGCPSCSGRVATPETSLAFKFPELLKEWDYELNKEDPNNVTYGSGLKAWWICSNGHSYPSVVCDRTAKRHQNGCPKCVYLQSSKMEIRVYCEIKYYFPDAIHHYRIQKRECDIFVPSLNIGIEIDGGLWHRGRGAIDEAKMNLFKKNGVKLISVREEGLEMFNEHTVVYPKGYSILEDIVKPLMAKLSVMFNDNRLEYYKLNNSFINSEVYEDYIKNYPINGYRKIAKAIRNRI